MPEVTDAANLKKLIHAEMVEIENVGYKEVRDRVSISGRVQAVRMMSTEFLVKWPICAEKLNRKKMYIFIGDCE